MTARSDALDLNDDEELMLELLYAMTLGAAKKRVKIDLAKGQAKGLTSRELCELMRVVRRREVRAIRALRRETGTEER